MNAEPCRSGAWLFIPLILLPLLLPTAAAGATQTAEARARAESVRQQALTEVREARARSESLRQQALTEALLTRERAEYVRQAALETQQAARSAAEADRRLAREEALAVRERVLAAQERVRAAEEGAAGRARDAVRRYQQVVVTTRGRIRLGVSFLGEQGEEFDRQGARIETVLEDSPAEEAGLREGDVITHLNGHSLLEPVAGEEELDFSEDESLPVQRVLALARKLKAGEEVEIRYLRDGTPATVAFEAGDLDQPVIAFSPGGREAFPRILRVDPQGKERWEFVLPEREGVRLRIPRLDSLKALEELEDLHLDMPALRLFGPEGSGVRGWVLGEPEGRAGIWTLAAVPGLGGVRLMDLSPELGAYFSTDKGVLVLEVEEDSALGLLPGDVIQAVDGRKAETVRDLRRILASYEEGETAAVTVLRHGRETRLEGTVK